MPRGEPIEQRKWDFLVVGTGVGGATLGHALAKAGRKVLFLENGRAAFLYPDALRGEYPELRFPRAEAPTVSHAALLAKAGRYHAERTPLPARLAQARVAR